MIFKLLTLSSSRLVVEEVLVALTDEDVSCFQVRP